MIHFYRPSGAWEVGVSLFDDDNFEKFLYTTSKGTEIQVRVVNQIVIICNWYVTANRVYRASYSLCIRRQRRWIWWLWYMNMICLKKRTRKQKYAGCYFFFVEFRRLHACMIVNVGRMKFSQTHLIYHAQRVEGKACAENYSSDPTLESTCSEINQPLKKPTWKSVPPADATAMASGKWTSRCNSTMVMASGKSTPN